MCLTAALDAFAGPMAAAAVPMAPTAYMSPDAATASALVHQQTMLTNAYTRQIQDVNTQIKAAETAAHCDLAVRLVIFFVFLAACIAVPLGVLYKFKIIFNN